VDLDLEKMAKRLEASGRYRILRRLEFRPAAKPSELQTKLGLFIDVETTGLDPVKDEVIELAMVPFTFSSDGRIFEIKTPFHKFREPSGPIPSQITALTGITDEMVAGQTISPEEIAAFVDDAALKVSHNASFDRRFCERLSGSFASKPWACSMTQVDWASEGYEGVKLAYLVTEAGFFYDRHRATNDCLAAIQMLSTSLPKSNLPAMAKLLENARRSSWRIWAENAPFDLKDVLKSRGYRWNGDVNGSPRAWYIDVSDEDRESELKFLRAEIYRREADLFTKKITAFERFSIRS